MEEYAFLLKISGIMCGLLEAIEQTHERATQGVLRAKLAWVRTTLAQTIGAVASATATVAETHNVAIAGEMKRLLDSLDR